MGTHIDAPYHFVPNGRRIHDIDVNRFIGQGYLIDLSDHKRDRIVLDDIQKIAMETGCIIIIYTGLKNYWHGTELDEARAHAELSEEAAKYLRARIQSYRRRGVGRDLLNRFIEECRKRGARKISLDTDPRLVPAIQLYERSGFTQEGSVTNPYGLELILYSKNIMSPHLGSC